MHTPGHSPGHCCFLLEQERVLLAGDHLLPRITPHVGLFPAGDPNPLASFLASLERIGQEPIDLCLPGHGEPFGDVRRSIDSLFAHHERRLGSVLEAIGNGSRTAWEVSLDVFREAAGFHRIAALLETLAHLTYAESRGWVVRHADAAGVRWTA